MSTIMIFCALALALVIKYARGYPSKRQIRVDITASLRLRRKISIYILLPVSRLVSVKNFAIFPKVKEKLLSVNA